MLRHWEPAEDLLDMLLRMPGIVRMTMVGGKMSPDFVTLEIYIPAGVFT